MSVRKLFFLTLFFEANPAIRYNLLLQNHFLQAMSGASLVALPQQQKKGFLTKGFSLLSGLKPQLKKINIKKINKNELRKRPQSIARTSEAI